MSLEVETWSNLKNFYQAIADSSGLPSGRISGITYVMHPEKRWPSYILGGEHLSESTLNTVVSEIKDERLPRFWIRLITPGKEFENKTRKYGIKPVDNWIGMWLERDRLFGQLAPDSGCLLERITGERELREWLGIVNLEIMEHSSIDYRLFRNTLQRPDFEFFRVTRGKKTAATLLGFRDKSVTGLYMISVKKEFRNQGFGRWITEEAIDYYIRKGDHKFVLHSTTDGYPLYKKLGFSENNRFGIYRITGNTLQDHR